MWTYKDLAQLAAHPAHAAAIESNSGRVCHRGCVLVRMARVAMQALTMKALLAALIFFLGALVPAQARDDGRYANEPLHAWFDQLASRNGLCCSFGMGSAFKMLIGIRRTANIACAFTASGSSCLTMLWSQRQINSVQPSSGPTWTLRE